MGRDGVPWEHLGEVGTILERKRWTNAVWKRMGMCGDFDVWQQLFVALRIFIGWEQKIPAAYKDRQQGKIMSVGAPGYDPETGAGCDMTTDYLRCLASVVRISSPWRSRAMIVPSGPNRIMHGMPVMP